MNLLLFLEKLNFFVNERNNNFANLRWMLPPTEHLEIGMPATKGLSPFGMPITIITDVFTKQELVSFLENRKIRTRPVFGGNLTRQPAFRKMYYEQIGGLENSDYIMDRTFWIGVHPSLTQPQLEYVVESFYAFFRERGLK